MLLGFDRYGDNPSLCSNGDSCQLTRKKSNAVYIAVPIVAFVVVATLVLLLCLLRRKKGKFQHPLMNLMLNLSIC